jgi:polysaccharide pyruvyl transferase WcaK-like protein
MQKIGLKMYFSKWKNCICSIKDSLYLKNIKIAKINKKKNQLKICHISAFSFGNAGDTLLPVVLRDLFEKTIVVKNWYHIHVHKVVTNKLVKKINKRTILLIGGGGLFLKDTNKNNISGWQWSCSIEQLNKIEIPIIMFAVGYNRFRGQEDFDEIFTKHLNVFVRKAVFIGIRNTGSINKLKTYLETNELKQKLQFQPCMTTLIAKIYEHKIHFLFKEDFIAVNCAFDRQNLRLLSEELLYSISRVIKELSKITKIKYYAHMSDDNKMLTYFDELDIQYKLIELHGIKQIIQEYKKPRLVIGMRGHAQMIPFGCLTPILSIISHDKMNWFLEDIGHPEWGVDVLQQNFESNLLEKAIYLYNN